MKNKFKIGLLITAFALCLTGCGENEKNNENKIEKVSINYETESADEIFSKIEKINYVPEMLKTYKNVVTTNKMYYGDTVTDIEYMYFSNDRFAYVTDFESFISTKDELYGMKRDYQTYEAQFTKNLMYDNNFYEYLFKNNIETGFLIHNPKEKIVKNYIDEETKNYVIVTKISVEDYVGEEIEGMKEFRKEYFINKENNLVETINIYSIDNINQESLESSMKVVVDTEEVNTTYIDEAVHITDKTKETRKLILLNVDTNEEVSMEAPMGVYIIPTLTEGQKLYLDKECTNEFYGDYDLENKSKEVTYYIKTTKEE